MATPKRTVKAARPKTPKALPPKAVRPVMPGYGLPKGTKGLLKWAWAEQRLVRSHNYWVVTVRPGGRPHAMPVWGLWMEGQFWFSSGAQSRKARNLVRNARCVVCTEQAEEAVVVEGTARVVKDRKLLARVVAPYRRKYGWTLDPAAMPIYAVRPQVAFGLDEKRFIAGATKWVF